MDVHGRAEQDDAEQPDDQDVDGDDGPYQPRQPSEAVAVDQETLGRGFTEEAAKETAQAATDGADTDAGVMPHPWPQTPGRAPQPALRTLGTTAPAGSTGRWASLRRPRWPRESPNPKRTTPRPRERPKLNRRRTATGKALAMT